MFLNLKTKILIETFYCDVMREVGLDPDPSLSRQGFI